MRRFLDQKLKLHQLRAVEAIAAQSSLLKAATVLAVSQPALTKTIRELETIVGVPLFERHARGMRPTPAGETLLRSARRVLADLRRLDEDLDHLDDPAGGAVALGALPVAAAGILPGVLTRLKARHPTMSVRLQQGRTEDLIPALVAGEIDLIVGRLYDLPADGLPREPLWAEPIVFLARAGHPIFVEPRIAREDLRRYDLVLPTVGQRVGQEIDRLLAALDLPADAALRSSSYNLIREMLHETDMISVMPRLMMVGDLLRGTLRVADPPVAAAPRPAGVIRAADRRLGPAAEAFLVELRAYVGEISARGFA